VPRCTSLAEGAPGRANGRTTNGLSDPLIIVDKSEKDFCCVTAKAIRECVKADTLLRRKLQILALLCCRHPQLLGLCHKGMC
jgi:hypothetical protein